MQALSEWVHKIFTKGDGERRIGKDKLVMVVLTGILLLIIVWPVSDKNTADTSQTAGTLGTGNSQDAGKKAVEGQDALWVYGSEMESQLTQLLSAIEGAGQVKVMITFKSGTKQIVEKDVDYSENITAASASGSQGSTSVTRSESTVSSGANGAAPYVIQEIVPEIEGVVVAAEGADDIQVTDEITYAVQVLFDLPVHRIRVVKMNAE